MVINDKIVADCRMHRSVPAVDWCGGRREAGRRAHCRGGGRRGGYVRSESVHICITSKENFKILAPNLGPTHFNPNSKMHYFLGLLLKEDQANFSNFSWKFSHILNWTGVSHKHLVSETPLCRDGVAVNQCKVITSSPHLYSRITAAK